MGVNLLDPRPRHPYLESNLIQGEAIQVAHLDHSARALWQRRECLVQIKMELNIMAVLGRNTLSQFLRSLTHDFTQGIPKGGANALIAPCPVASLARLPTLQSLQYPESSVLKGVLKL